MNRERPAGRHPDVGPPTCRTCGLPIAFARTRATGRPMPVDYGMNPAGNVAAKRVGRQWVDLYVLTDAEPLRPGYTRLMAHWKTCADPDKFRTPRPKGGTPDRPAPPADVLPDAEPLF